jgi:hypothetical protein
MLLHVNLICDVKIGEVEAKVKVFAFVGSDSDVDFDPDTISDIRVNGVFIHDQSAFFSMWKAMGVNMAKQMRDLAVELISLDDRKRLFDMYRRL